MPVGLTRGLPKSGHGDGRRRSVEVVLVVVHSRLGPMQELGRTIKAHWEEILKNYFDHRRTNGVLEAVNGLVQAARLKARGYRNVENLITIVYLIAGKLRFETCMG